MAVRNPLALAEGVLLDEDLLPGSVRDRQARVREPHVAALNAHAEAVASAEGRAVPWFDPAGGGTGAAVLFLMQDPSRRAAHGSRLVSRHNDDATAYTLHRLCTDAGLPVAATVHWNVVPWWAGDPLAVPREGLVAAVRRARPHLRTLLDLLPGPRVVVLLGRHAQRAWDAAGVDDGGRAVLRGPHPSPNATINRDRATGRPNLELLADTVRAAAAAAGAGGAPEADTDPR